MLFRVYALLTGLTALGSYLFGLFVFFQGPARLLHRRWCYFCFSVGTWSLGYYITMLPGISKNIALLSSRFSHASGAMIPAFFFAYVITWVDAERPPRFLLRLSYIACGIFALLSLTPFILADVIPKLSFSYYPVGRLGFAFCAVNFIGWVVYTHIYMFKNVKNFSSLKKNQFIYFLIGTILGYLGGITYFPLIIGIKIFPYPTVLMILYLLTTTFAILKYRLMGIQVIIARSFILFCAYLPLILIAMFLWMPWGRFWLQPFIVQDRWYLVSLTFTLGVVLSAITTYPYFYFQQKYDQRRLGHIKTQLERLREITKRAIDIHWERLLHRITPFLMQMYRKYLGAEIEYAALYFMDEKEDKYKLFSHKSRKFQDYLKESISKMDIIPGWFNETAPYFMKQGFLDGKYRVAFTYEDIDYYQSRQTNRRLIECLEKVKCSLKALKAEVCVFCFYQNRLLAFLLLGRKRRGFYSEEEVNTFTSLAHSVSMALRNAELIAEAEQSRLDSIYATVAALEERDLYTKGHSVRVAAYAKIIAEELMLAGALPYAKIFHLFEKTELAGLLHDVGKIGVRDDILYKAGRLTVEEFDEVKRHPLSSLHIVETIKSISGEVKDGIKYHHEKFDGTGYTTGEKGQRIPAIARILAVADAYDAMTSQRSYRKHAKTEQEAMREINKVSGAQFDPAVVDSFDRAFKKGKLKKLIV